MKEQILENAEINSTRPSDQVEWLKLSDFGDLVSVEGLLSDSHKELLSDAVEKQKLAIDIKDEVTFAFWKDENGKLCFDR